jgi:hypothetical protein
MLRIHFLQSWFSLVYCRLKTGNSENAESPAWPPACCRSV